MLLHILAWNISIVTYTCPHMFVAVYSSVRKYLECVVAWEERETRRNRWCRIFPVDWGISEKLIIFLVVRRGSKGRKMPRGHCYLSIYLSLFLPCRWIYLCISHLSCLILSGHSSYFRVQLHSHHFLSLLSSHLAPFFFSSPSPVFLSCQTGLWASLSISRISLSCSIIPGLFSSYLTSLLAFSSLTYRLS